MDYTVHGILQARILEWVAFPLSRGSFQPRDWTQVSCTAGRFFTSWAKGEKPKNTGVGSLSLLQWIFPTQESNPGLLNCKWILYQLSYQGNPTRCFLTADNLLDLSFCHHASLTRHLAACRAIHATCTTDALAPGLPRSPVALVPLHCLQIPELLVLSPPINP